MKNRTSQLLYSYWNDVRGDRMAPARFEIEPSRIAAILSETFILERTESGVFRFRLAGTRICEQFGREFRGENLMALFDAEDQDLIERDLKQISQQGAVGILTIEAATQSGRLAEFEVMLLPLVHTHQAVNRILGTVSSSHAPAWLGSEPMVAQRLLRQELIWPAGRSHAVASRMNRPAPVALTTPQARIVASNRRTFRVYEGGLGKHPNGKD